MTVELGWPMQEGDRVMTLERGLLGFGEWLLAVPTRACCILDEADGRVISSLGVEGRIGGDGMFPSMITLLGLNRTSAQGNRRARLTVGFDPWGQRNLLWVVTPVEADPPGYRLQVSLLAGTADGQEGLSERLEVAMRDATTRHSATQPLTALSFLLENLLYAFLESTPDEDYLAAKRSDLLDQIDRVSQLLTDIGVLRQPS